MVLVLVDELHPQHQQHTLAGVLLVEDDSSCWLARDGSSVYWIVVMFIVGLGLMSISTFDDQLVVC